MMPTSCQHAKPVDYRAPSSVLASSPILAATSGGIGLASRWGRVRVYLPLRTRRTATSERAGRLFGAEFSSGGGCSLTRRFILRRSPGLLLAGDFVGQRRHGGRALGRLEGDLAVAGHEDSR